MPSNYHIDKMPERESNALNYRRTAWLRRAICPHCGAANIESRSMLITLNEDGTANCAEYSKSWKPTL